MSDRPRGDPGWAWYEREVARLETALAEEREKNERLRGALKQLAQNHHGTIKPSELHRGARTFDDCVAGTCERARAALASTGSEER